MAASLGIFDLKRTVKIRVQDDGTWVEVHPVSGEEIVAPRVVDRQEIKQTVFDVLRRDRSGISVPHASGISHTIAVQLLGNVPTIQPVDTRAEILPSDLHRIITRTINNSLLNGEELAIQIADAILNGADGLDRVRRTTLTDPTPKDA